MNDRRTLFVDTFVVIATIGHTTTVAPSAKQATGNYRSSKGVTGEEVWGTRARWMDRYGNINRERVALVICDHPKNVNYPTNWHARGYDLFAANPFGSHDLTKGNR